MNAPSAPLFRRALYSRGVAVLVALVLALGAGAARAQTQTFDSLAGAWWFSLGGKDAGAVLIEFSVPISGNFAVRDIVLTGHQSFGFSRALGAFFVVEAGQPLMLDSKGNITGTLELSDADTSESIGEIVFERGKPSNKFTKFESRGTVQSIGGLSLVVKFNGGRVPATFPVLTGRNTAAPLAGKGVKSKVYELTLRTDTALGLPAYDFTGAGPAEIDKLEVPDVRMNGQLMLAPNNRVYGLLEGSSDFGTGSVKGTLSLPKSSSVPKVDLKIQADRKLHVYGKLTQPIEPVLSVQPTSFDFGAVRLDQTKTQVFRVENIGVGELSGAASFVGGSSPDFTISGAKTYLRLRPGDPPLEIQVVFDPSAEAARTGQIHFSVESGAGAKTVDLKGVGGMPVLTVLPATGVFGNVVVAESRTIPFTISNDGDGVLSGVATIVGTTDFALLLTDAGLPLASIAYTINPGSNQIIRVRLLPTAVGPRTATLNLTGGDGKSVALTGTGTAAIQ